MGTFDEFFLAFGPAFAGMNTFVVESRTNNIPVFDFGVGGLGKMAGVQGVVDVPQQPPSLVAGVYGSGIVQPGVIGFSRENDGLEGASFTGTAIRATSFFGPGVHSISGALSGVTGIANTAGPPVPNIANIAGVVGSSGDRPGVLGTSKSSAGLFGFSSDGVGVVGQTTNPASFAGFFNGNVIVVNGALTASVKNAVVAFPMARSACCIASKARSIGSRISARRSSREGAP
jgi:hypothetical protein